MKLGLQWEESRQVEQTKSAAPCYNKQGKLYLPPKKTAFGNIWKVCVALDRLPPPSADDKQQTNLAKNRDGAHGRLADALKGLSNELNAGAPMTAVCDVTSRRVERKKGKGRQGQRGKGGETPDRQIGLAVPCARCSV